MGAYWIDDRLERDRNSRYLRKHNEETYRRNARRKCLNALFWAALVSGVVVLCGATAIVVIQTLVEAFADTMGAL